MLSRLARGTCVDRLLLPGYIINEAHVPLTWFLVRVSLSSAEPLELASQPRFTAQESCDSAVSQ